MLKADEASISLTISSPSIIFKLEFWSQLTTWKDCRESQTRTSQPWIYEVQCYQEQIDDAYIVSGKCIPSVVRETAPSI